ncbi:MAG TPA: hypothetical protein VNR60_03190 [Croceibacterium sp.]|nr:hypothetical protein [Croceibacterium sp.]
MRIERDPPRPPLRQRRSAGERLREVLLELAGGQATALAHEETSWASVTFAGARHRVDLQFRGPEAVEAGEQFIALLPDHEFTLPRHLVADATVTQVNHRLDPPHLTVRCELLLIEED